MEGRPASRRGAQLLVCLLLIAADVAVFARVLGFDFVHYDDPLYVITNPFIHNGLTLDGLRWVFTHEHGGSWHPLTGLSHMLDCELFGLRPAGHHLTGLLLHIADSLLLFGMVHAATGTLWRSAIVALLFAVHPLHVEPVAWVSGRKDVLSTFFTLLSMWVWVAYARRGGARHYSLTLVLFALALMAKPMLVTLPLVFLLLDYWPLGRFGARGDTGDRGPAPERRAPTALVVEKLPFLALSALVSVVTYLGHRGAGTLTGGEAISPGQRLANAAMSYVRYLGKAVWPVDLTVHYPHPNLPGGAPWAWWQIAGAVAFLAIVSAWALRDRHRRPYVLAGWFWYLVTLVPVLGLVQVGRHAMADRYTYLPLVGPTIAVVWGLADVMERGMSPRSRRPLAAALAAVVVALLMMRSASQVEYWRDTTSLLTHALEVAPDAPEMHWALGRELQEQGRLDEAITHFRRAVTIRPDYPDADVDLGVALWTQGRTEEAIVFYERALRSAPENAAAHNTLGMALQAQGKVPEAIAHYREALRLRPAYPEAHTNLGIALHGTGDLEQAAAQYREALRLDPGRVEARINLAHILAARGNLEEAILRYGEALETDGRNGAVHLALARTLHAAGRLDDAIRHYQRALELGADEAEANSGIGFARYHQGRVGEAIEYYQRALAISPADAVAHNRLGKALAAIGRTDEAIGHYRRAVQIQPAFAAAHKNLAIALESQGRIEEARVHYRQAELGGAGQDAGGTGEARPMAP